MKMKNYVRPETLEEAYSLLLESPNNVLFAGGTLLTREHRSIDTGIEGLGILPEGVVLENDRIVIGAMTSYETLKREAGKFQTANAALLEQVLEVGGIQLRHQITVGGSVYSKTGIAWLNTMLLAMDAKLLLYHAGEVSLEDYFRDGLERDILLYISLEDAKWTCHGKAVFYSPEGRTILNAVAAESPDGFRVAIGSRPGTPVRVPEAEAILNQYGWTEEAARKLEELKDLRIFGTDLFGSKEYRGEIAGALLSEVAEDQWDDRDERGGGDA